MYAEEMVMPCIPLVAFRMTKITDKDDDQVRDEMIENCKTAITTAYEDSKNKLTNEYLRDKMCDGLFRIGDEVPLEAQDKRAKRDGTLPIMSICGIEDQNAYYLLFLSYHVNNWISCVVYSPNKTPAENRMYKDKTQMNMLMWDKRYCRHIKEGEVFDFKF